MRLDFPGGIFEPRSVCDGHATTHIPSSPRSRTPLWLSRLRALEFVQKHQAGLQSFRSMKWIEARRRKAQDWVVLYFHSDGEGETSA